MRGSQSTGLLEEILRRSGDSPLCVNVNIAPGSHDTKWTFLPIFLNIIEDAWDRVESLCADIRGAHIISNEIDARIWAAFDKPAPLLQEFNVMIETSVIKASSAPYLFGNHAPRLLKLDFRRAFSTSYSWFQNLVVLHFTPTSVAQALSVEVNQTTVILKD